MKLKPTFEGDSTTIEPGLVLQMLEAQGASGTFRMGRADGGEDWLRLRGGVVVKASADPVETVGYLLRNGGRFGFRVAKGEPHGGARHPITALLLESARIADEGSRR